jgi:hypothetical protein
VNYENYNKLKHFALSKPTRTRLGLFFELKWTKNRWSNLLPLTSPTHSSRYPARSVPFIQTSPKSKPLINRFRLSAYSTAFQEKLKGTIVTWMSNLLQVISRSSSNSRTSWILATDSPKVLYPISLILRSFESLVILFSWIKEWRAESGGITSSRT